MDELSSIVGIRVLLLKLLVNVLVDGWIAKRGSVLVRDYEHR